MYESPIQKLVTDIETNIRQQEENAVLQAVVSVGVNVDKEELIKALEYDRGQYEKGYADGCRDSRKQGRWVREYEYDFIACEYVKVGYSCDKCGCHYNKRNNYCPQCGAKMDGGKTDG